MSTITTSNEIGIYNDLINKLKSRNATIAVIGLGYVGLPNVVSKANRGFKVIGFDVDVSKIEQINNGFSYIGDVDTQELGELVSKDLIVATTDFTALKKADVITICVPTPIDQFKQPDLKFVKSAVKEITDNIKIGTLVMLESTTYPGTTEEFIVDVLEEKGFNVGEDIFVAYSPERVDPSNTVYNIDNTPRIVGGHTNACTQIAQAFLGNNVKAVSSTKVAEMTKVYENTFRYVNIALADELTLVSDRMEIDPWEVIDAAATKPFGFMPFYPSPGVGGHCIPVDPSYLSYKAKQFDYTTKIIDVAGELNMEMREYTINKLIKILNDLQKPINGAKVAILGVAYKKDVADVRESPIYKLLDKLTEYEAEFALFDPYVDSVKHRENQIIVKSVEYENLAEYDVVMILTDHSTFNYQEIRANSNVIFDTKNVFKSPSLKGKYYKL